MAGRGDMKARAALVLVLAASLALQAGSLFGQEPAGNPVASVPLDSLSETRARPVFAPTRRPPPVATPRAVVAAPPPAPVVAPRPAAPSLVLFGTVEAEGEKLAVFFDEASGVVVRLRLGQGHGGWTLRAIEGRTATLDQDGRRVTVPMSPPPIAAAPPAPAPDGDL